MIWSITLIKFAHSFIPNESMLAKSNFRTVPAMQKTNPYCLEIVHLQYWSITRQQQHSWRELMLPKSATQDRWAVAQQASTQLPRHCSNTKEGNWWFIIQIQSFIWKSEMVAFQGRY
jgi:hypothetical protein